MQDYKESILTLLGNEIDKLASNYSLQLNELNKKNVQLANEVEELIKENTLLKEQLVTVKDEMEFKNKYEILLAYMDMDRIISMKPYEIIDECILSGSEKDAILLLTTLKHLLENKIHLELTLYILELFEHNISLLELNDPKIKKLTLECFTTILVDETFLVNDEEIDPILITALHLLSKLKKSNMEASIIDFLDENIYYIIDTVFYQNSPEILISFVEVCYQYHLKQEIVDIYFRLVEQEWSYFDSSISKQEFTFLLWFAYLFEFDQKMLANSSDCLRWFNRKNVGYFIILLS